MGLTDKEIKEIRKEVDTSHNPLIFFDDDADGLCSFLMLYRHCTDGRGVIIKTTPRIDMKFLRKVDEYSPDKIFVVDIAEVTQEFIDSVNTRIIWIDHHQPLDRKGIKYYNPMNNSKKTSPTSHLVYSALKKNIWLAMVGCIGDWYIPDFKDDFIEEYPDLFSNEIKEPDKALFSTKIGLLAKIFSFILKGTTKDAMTCVKILTRIKEPYEILEQSTSQGRYIWKKFQKTNNIYEELLDNVKSDNKKILTYIYSGNKMSFTSDLSNELLYKYPDKIIVVGRDRNNEIKLSFRSRHIEILPLVEKALDGLEGFTGGHKHACGGMVKKQDFDEFIEKLNSLI